MNNVILSGRLVRDPEIRYTSGENQLAIATFTLAVDRPKRNGEKQDPDYPRCVAYGKTAETIEKYCKKGKPIMVTGRVKTGSYKNKDGETVYTTDVAVQSMEFMPSDKTESKPESKPADVQEAEKDGFEQIEEDVPF